ncbi:hypothetical protein P171DRAFT_490333 [Karstenula rhodostoma CBS 690.94]|uniref:Zn(2)-C6 fungal-type domain-containing protein n=1 Tax=Karstenula rhodostoma CBS 690.94 TaxID=1392251 RepID=A0A9P4U7B7_9PLEO|nr:hypothetical protein P171DRAFT_490333 [Karstenula rhodostoma CBS 690.94]
MTLEGAKKRKACQSCTKAKAKCSPFEDRLDICYRCQRLKKECVFGETVRKRAQKNRSRVKQLEQRVDTLIDLIKNGQPAANNVGTDVSATPQEVHLPLATPSESAADLDGRSENAQNYYSTPAESPENILYAPAESSFTAYDPVEAGLLDDCTADSLLQEYKDSCTSAFPFVIVAPSVKGKELRQSQPFLFHAILTVTTCREVGLQLTLAAKLKEQIALRVINHSHKSLELLQGILLFTEWYHFYYDPIRQQLATMLQLCVAMIQDLGFSKNTQNAKRKITMGEIGANIYSVRSLAVKRAFLGTFYLAANFAQAWRRPTTLTHTRYMDQCCQHLRDCQEYTTDTIITPLVQLSTLICRIQDYFSYYDIENADVKGEALVHTSVANFDRELASITDSIPQTLIQSNPTLRISIRLIDIWIYESAVHESLWVMSNGPAIPTMTTNRLKSLYRCLTAVQSHMATIIAVPDASLHHLGFPSWASWCYACIVACKLAFLTDECEQQTGINETFIEVFNLVMDKSLFHEPRPCSLPAEVISSTWNPVFVAKEGEILSLFHRMYSKMKFTLPKDPDNQTLDHCKIDPLSRIAYFQKNILCSLTNRLNEHIKKIHSSENTNNSTKNTSAVVLRENWVAPQTDHARQRHDKTRIPLMQNMNFNSMNFDSIAPPENSMLLDGTFEDWLWKTAMDDFTMPPL